MMAVSGEWNISERLTIEFAVIPVKAVDEFMAVGKKKEPDRIASLDGKRAVVLAEVDVRYPDEVKPVEVFLISEIKAFLRDFDAAGADPFHAGVALQCRVDYI
jgi:hypothetical protein